jgi:hypothetical protein
MGLVKGPWWTSVAGSCCGEGFVFKSGVGRLETRALSFSSLFSTDVFGSHTRARLGQCANTSVLLSNIHSNYTKQARQTLHHYLQIQVQALDEYTGIQSNTYK